ncbi:MAG: sigma-70 family RNA polymerase sigma factor [Bacteroidia bacterium]|nr:sigma-70 family RNA polymerase sigma factor [Bacteroidia bacterium]
MRIAGTYSEAELVEGCQREDPKWQRLLYQQYYRLMFGVCLRYTDNRDDAQDILQEGFVKAFRNIRHFRSEGSFEGWLRRIMIHACIEHYRRKSRYFMVDIEEARQVGFEADALAALSRDEILGLIRELPPGYRTVFNLYAVEGYSHQEISEMLNISVGTSKSQLARAKKVLQDRITILRYQAGNG